MSRSEQLKARQHIYSEIGRVFKIDGLMAFQLQNQHEADAIYEEQNERDQYYDRYRDAGAGDSNNLGYAADFEEGYGDETEFNIQSDHNDMNFVSARSNFVPLRRQNHNFRVRGRAFGRGQRPNQPIQNSKHGLHIDVP